MPEVHIPSGATIRRAIEQRGREQREREQRERKKKLAEAASRPVQPLIIAELPFTDGRRRLGHADPRDLIGRTLVHVHSNLRDRLEPHGTRDEEPGAVLLIFSDGSRYRLQVADVLATNSNIYWRIDDKDGDIMKTSYAAGIEEGSVEHMLLQYGPPRGKRVTGASLLRCSGLNFGQTASGQRWKEDKTHVALGIKLEESPTWRMFRGGWKSYDSNSGEPALKEAICYDVELVRVEDDVEDNGDGYSRITGIGLFKHTEN